jgi:valyl-tRNA synthetase
MEAIKNFFLMDLSKTYVQFIRDSLEDPKVQKVLYDSYFDALTLLAPFLPFTTEKINLDIYKKNSIHLQQWPKPDKNFINEKLEQSMQYADLVIKTIMALRGKININVRWPLRKAVVYIDEGKEWAIPVLRNLKALILKQTNIKGLNFEIIEKELNKELTGLPFVYGHIILDSEMNKTLEQEGFARELTRRIQDLRKKAGLKKEDNIELYIKFEIDLKDWLKQIKEKCGVKKLHLELIKSVKFKDQGEIRNKKFEIGFNVV